MSWASQKRAWRRCSIRPSMVGGCLHYSCPPPDLCWLFDCLVHHPSRAHDLAFPPIAHAGFSIAQGILAELAPPKLFMWGSEFVGGWVGGASTEGILAELEPRKLFV